MVLLSSVSRNLLCLSILVATSTVFSQDNSRNISIPTQSTTSSNTQSNTSPTSTSNNGGNANNSGGNANQASNNSSSLASNATVINNNSTRSGTTPAANLTPIADSPGGVSVPVPASVGGQPNGRFGPDDQYIAAMSHISVPYLATFTIIPATILILIHSL